MHIKSKEFQMNLAKLVAKSWVDENFRQRFLAEPMAILREAGTILEESVKVIAKEGASASKLQACPEGGTIVYEIALPSKPKDLDEEALYTWFNQFSSGACCGHTVRFSCS